MKQSVRRILATTAASAALFAGVAATAHAASFYNVPVGSEVCVSTFIANTARVQGASSPNAARFQVKRGGVILYQGTSTGFVAQYTGAGFYELCGKNKLGNPGPIHLQLAIS